MYWTKYGFSAARWAVTEKTQEIGAFIFSDLNCKTIPRKFESRCIILPLSSEIFLCHDVWLCSHSNLAIYSHKSLLRCGNDYACNMSHWLLYADKNHIMTSMSEKLFKDRPEWNDITPIPQHDPSANPIAPIFYNEACKYSAFSCSIYAKRAYTEWYTKFPMHQFHEQTKMRQTIFAAWSKPRRWVKGYSNLRRQ